MMMARGRARLGACGRSEDGVDRAEGRHIFPAELVQLGVSRSAAELVLVGWVSESTFSLELSADNGLLTFRSLN